MSPTTFRSLANKLRPERYEQAFRVATHMPYPAGEFRRQGVLVGLSIAVRLDVGIHHTAAPIKALCIEGCETAQGSSGTYSFSQHGGTGQSVRSTVGPADDTESIDVQGIGDGRDVAGGVHDSTPWLGGRTAVAGSVVANQADAKPVQDDPARMRAIAAAGCAV